MSKVPQYINGLLENLPQMLIEERLRLAITQKQLALALKIHEQQIQRYEASQYQSASLRRLREVAKALYSLGSE